MFSTHLSFQYKCSFKHIQGMKTLDSNQRTVPLKVLYDVNSITSIF